MTFKSLRGSWKLLRGVFLPCAQPRSFEGTLVAREEKAGKIVGGLHYRIFSPPFFDSRNSGSLMRNIILVCHGTAVL